MALSGLKPVLPAKDFRGFVLKMGVYVLPFAVMESVLTPYIGSGGAFIFSTVGLGYTMFKGETDWLKGYFPVPDRFMINLEKKFPWLKSNN